MNRIKQKHHMSFFLNLHKPCTLCHSKVVSIETLKKWNGTLWVPNLARKNLGEQQTLAETSELETQNTTAYSEPQITGVKLLLWLTGINQTDTLH